MPPTSRGLLLLRNTNRTPLHRPQSLRPRHASFKRPAKIPAGLRPQHRKPVPEVEITTPEPSVAPEKPHWACIVYARLRGNASFKQALRFLPWLPIIAVIYHHFPLAVWPIEGPSMQPTFNPDHTREQGTLNSRTLVLVQKQQFTNTSISRGFRALLPAARSKRAEPGIQRGQIVVYRTPHNPLRIGVKRVVGIPGDRVTPLPGYPGGDDPVIIPFNHLCWKATADLVVGRVLVTLPSFTPWFHGWKWEDAEYPAKHRVEHNVVQQVHPDEELAARAFQDGKMVEALETVKAYPIDRKLTPMERKQWDDLYMVAVREKEKKNLETYELANQLEAELRMKLYGRAITTTLRNVEMSKEEFLAFQKNGVVPESVLARSNLDGA